MNAEKIAELANGQNKHLAVMSKQVKETQEGYNFVSAIIGALANKRSGWWIVAALIAFITTAICFIVYCCAAGTKTELLVAINLIPMACSFIWLLLEVITRSERQAVLSEKSIPIAQITFIENLFGKSMKDWSDDFDPCKEAGDHLKKMAQAVKDAEFRDSLAPWNPEQAPKFRNKFNDTYEQIQVVLPIEDKDIIFENKPVKKISKEQRMLAAAAEY